MAHFEAARQAGLVDIKFFIMDAGSLSEEETFAAANKIEDLVARGECERTEVWANDMEPKASSLLA
jgi:hypothetical protein